MIVDLIKFKYRILIALKKKRLLKSFTRNEVEFDEKLLKTN